MSKPKEEKQKQPDAKKDELEKLYQLIDELQKEKDEIFGKLQRVGADYANYQKRTARQIAETIAYEKEQIVKTLLPVLDNFEHTLANVPSAENVDSLIKGVKITYDQMLATLKAHGIEQIETLNEKFDPALHQAIMQRYEADKKEGIVLEEFQKGYKLNGRVVRPSRVIVNKPPAEQQEKPEEEKDNLQEQIPEDERTPSGE